MYTEAEQKFRDATWRFWTPTGSKTPPCIKCLSPAVTLHEIDPKSLDREWAEHGPEDSVPICADCHEWATGAGDAGQIELREKAVARMQQLGDWGRREVRDVSVS